MKRSRAVDMIIVFCFSLTPLTPELPAQVMPQDSLALVALYNSTDGAHWTNHSNWLSGAVGSWYGISISGGRVVGITLEGNNLNGPIPAEIGDLTNLRYIYFRRNQLSGPIPTTIGKLTNLELLTCSNNQLSGSIPDEIGNLVKLTILQLNQNKLTGDFPSSIYNLTKLEILLLNVNQLTGTLSPLIGNLKEMENFSLSSNKLQGIIPTEIGGLTQLSYLNLGINQFSGTIPREIGNLVNLSSLQLYRTQLTGTIPTEIGMLSKLTRLDLFANELDGPIPVELYTLTNLEYLYLGGNHLTGTISPNIGNLTNLLVLQLYGNELTGPIPSQIGQLAKLTDLRLYNNQLSDTIPHTLGNLSQLRTCHIYSNLLRGAVPVSVGSLFNLQELFLSDNQLTDLPDLIRDTSLVNLQIQNNKFTYEDIEPNMGVPTFYYAPQDSVGVPQDTTVQEGQSITLSVQVGGTSNLYQWLRDNNTLQGATNASLYFESAASNHSGTYICRITNTMVPHIALYSRAIHLRVGATGVQHQNGAPLVFELQQNFPNPFNEETEIRYSLAKQEQVRLEIFDVQGKCVRRLQGGGQDRGEKCITWNATDERGLAISSGVYYYRLQAGPFVAVKKMMLVK